MNLYDENGYVNIREILKLNLPFTIVVGGRATGKTYTTLKTAVEDNITFMYMRRLQSQADLINKPDFSPFKRINTDLHWNIATAPISKYNAGFYNQRLNEEQTGYELYGKPIGYTCALSTVSNLRGFDASDVDLLIEGDFSDIEAFPPLTLQRINKQFEIEFFDWATSLMPDEYVVTFYLKNTSIFWNIDVQFISDSLYKPSSKFINNPIHHLIKLWILNLKYLQRQQYDKLTVEKLARKLDITDDITSYPKIMRKIFENIQNQSDKKLRFFLLECEKELEIYEKQFVQIDT